MIHYTKWFRPQAEMYHLKSGCGFTASRMMLALREAVRAAKEYSISMWNSLYLFETLLLALYEFEAIDFSTYEHGINKVRNLVISIYRKNEYKEIF